MPMSERHFQVFEKYLNVRMRSLNLQTVPDLFQTMKVDWDILQDEPAMQRVLEHTELVQKRTTRDTEDIQRPALLARIAELEALEPAP